MPSQRTLYHVAQLYLLLPDSFLRKYAIKQIAPKIYLRPRTVDKYLNALITYGKLKRDGGMYMKSAMPSDQRPAPDTASNHI